MKRFKRIVYAVSYPHTEPVGWRRAVELAEENQAHLCLLGVVPEVTCQHPAGRDLDKSDIQRLMVQDCEKRLGEWLSDRARNMHDAELKVVSGTASIEIARDVETNSRDLIMLPPDPGEHGHKRWLVGGTCLSLMRKCPCPVWVVRPEHAAPYEKVIAAVDRHPVHDPEDSLSIKILDLATSLAALERSQLHVVHVWNIFAENLLRSHSRMSPGDIDTLNRDTLTSRTEWLETLMKRYDSLGLETYPHIIKGDPTIVIPKLAAREQAQLLVMGTVCRTGISGWLMGNTAERILEQVDCSLLTVKPENHGKQPHPK